MKKYSISVLALLLVQSVSGHGEPASTDQFEDFDYTPAIIFTVVFLVVMFLPVAYFLNMKRTAVKSTRD